MITRPVALAQREQGYSSEQQHQRHRQPTSDGCHVPTPSHSGSTSTTSGSGSITTPDPQDSGRHGHSPPIPGPSPQRPSPRSGANPVSGVGENSPLSALEIPLHLDLYFRYPPNPAQPGPTCMQRQFTSHLVDLYLIPITTPPTPSLRQPDLCQFTFSPHDIPHVPLSTTQIRQATGPYFFYARTGRNQA